MSVAVAIKIGSPKGTLKLVETTIQSIKANIGTSDYRFIISMEPHIEEDIKRYVRALKRAEHELVDLMPEESITWADFFNSVLNRAKGCKYFIQSHDDIELLTPNLISTVESALKTIRSPVGWLNFTDKDYLSGHWAPSTRPGCHVDHVFENAWRKRKMFQFHALNDNWWEPPPFAMQVYRVRKKINRLLRMEMPRYPTPMKRYFAKLPYDFPKAPVKCHAPFCHFVLIEMEKLLKLGECANWGYHNVSVDEDWGLRALKLGLNNIWIPDIEYVHYRDPDGGTRSGPIIAKEGKRVHQSFFEKWGFHSEGRAEEIDFIKKEYKNTNVPWSTERRSYEWDYIQ